MANEKTLELVVFQLADGVTDEEFLETTGPVSDWIKTQPGFISRELSRGTEGDKWVEVVWWETLEQAKAASEAAMSSAKCAPMFSKIKFDNIKMIHGTQAIPKVISPRSAA